MRYFYDGDAGEEPDEPDESRDDTNDETDDEPDDDEDLAGSRDTAGEDDDDEDVDVDADGDLLDDDFPRGDGTADTTAIVYCPYCGELNEIGVDPGGGSAQSYVEDCQVCCRPWRVVVAYDASGQALATVEVSDD